MLSTSPEHDCIKGSFLYPKLINKMTISEYNNLVSLLDNETENGEQMLSLIDAWINTKVDTLIEEV